MALMVRNWNVYFPLTTWSSSDCFCLDDFPRRRLLRPHSPSPVLFCAFPGHSRQLLHPRGGKDTKSVPSSQKWGYGSPPLPTPRPSLAPQDPAAASLPSRLRGPRTLRASPATHPSPSRGRPIRPVHSSGKTPPAAPTARGQARGSSPGASFPGCPALCARAGSRARRSRWSFPSEANPGAAPWA